MNAAALASVAARRSAVYWGISEIFLICPDEGFVERLRRDIAGVATEAAAGLPAVQLAALHDALPDSDDAGGITELAVEYTRLFSGVGARNGPPPPYESVHRRNAVASETTTAVESHYAQAGLAMLDTAAPADHLGVELKFIALLCHEEMDAWRNAGHGEATRALRRQSDFLDEHVLQWAPEYLRLLHDQTNHGLFRAAIALTLDALTVDRAHIQEMRLAAEAA